MLWDSIAEDTHGEMAIEYSSCQMPRDLNPVPPAAATNNTGSHYHHSLSLMNNSLHEMAIEELSFYGDDVQDDHLQHHPQLQDGSAAARRLRSTTFDIPQQVGLLPPEGSPRRFRIVERPKQQKFRQSLTSGGENINLPNSNATRQEKLQNANAHNSTSMPVPTKSLRIFHSLSSGSMESSSMDEDYMELFEMESLDQSSQPSNSLVKMPSDLNSLFSGQIKSLSPPMHRLYDQSKDVQQLKTPEMRRPPVRRCLSMSDNYFHSPKTPETLLKQVQETATSPFGGKLLTAERTNTTNSCFKRPDPPSKTNSPVQIKRYRAEADKENLNDSLIMSLTTLPVPRSKQSQPPPLRKCMSMNDAEIMSALARSENKDEPDLIGDFSQPFALPLMEGRHRDLKSISCDTMARLLQGEFNDVVANYRIIDCRYPYEFDGGHIRGAENLYTHEQIIEEFLTQLKTDEQHQQPMGVNKRRNIIIFHCEFSSERGPKLSRFLRNNDRERNTNCYPTLDYPEIYLLHNGYKEFYEKHSELCSPIAYRPMLEPAYNNAYRHFRSKSKSWNGEGGLGGATSRTKKARSRLML